MGYKGVIFDLDGVLCHTDNYHYKAWKVIADALNIPFDEAINNRLRGVSRLQSLNIILERYEGKPLTPTEKEHLTTEKNELYRCMLTKMTPEDLEDEVKAVLDSLQAQGVRLAIASSSRNAPFILERLGIEAYFDAVSDGNTLSRSKPNPEVFLKAAKLLCMAPEDCLVVEDADAGIEAAVCGGFDCAGIGQAAKNSKATYSLRNLNDLLHLPFHRTGSQ